MLFFGSKVVLLWVSGAFLQKECKLCLVYLKFLVAVKVVFSTHLQEVPLPYLWGRENTTYLTLYEVPFYLPLPQAATVHHSVQSLCLLTFSSTQVFHKYEIWRGEEGTFTLHQLIPHLPVSYSSSHTIVLFLISSSITYQEGLRWNLFNKIYYRSYWQCYEYLEQSNTFHYKTVLSYLYFCQL